MSDKIVAALKTLDVENDQHWTSDGAPRIDTLKILVGNPGLSREDVNAALPGFSRSTAKTFAETGTSGAAPAQTPAPGAPAVATQPGAATATATPQEPAPAAPEQGDGLGELPNLNDEPLSEAPEAKRGRYSYMPDASQMDIEEAREYLSQLIEARSQIQQAIPEVQNRLASLEAEQARQDETQVSPVQAYLASQVRLGQERAELRRTVEQSGMDLKELSLRLKGAPIDEALNSRPRASRQLKK